MKKLVGVILVLMLCFSLCACGEGESVKDKVGDAVQLMVISYVDYQYDIRAVTNVTAYVEEISENEFEVSGKVTALDDYGDSYTGKYDAVAVYDPETDYCDVIDCNVDTMYKE